MCKEIKTHSNRKQTKMNYAQQIEYIEKNIYNWHENPELLIIRFTPGWLTEDYRQFVADLKTGQITLGSEEEGITDEFVFNPYY